MSLRRAFALAAAALLLLGPGPVAAETQRLGLTAFDRVSISGNVAVRIVDDHRLFAVAEGERDALDALDVSVSNGTLSIRPRSQGRFGATRRNAGPVTVEVHAQNLRFLSVNGGATATVERLRGASVQVMLNGSGAITIAAIASPNVTMRLEGSGRITAAGATQQLTAGATGAGGIDASALRAERLRVVVGGTGTSQFNAVRGADVLTSGDASLTVAGRARCTVRNAGRGTVECAGGIATAAAPR